MSFRTPMISIIQGDIAELEVDIIVNATKSTLTNGGGGEKSLHRVAGTSLMEECRIEIFKNGILPTGEARLTGAGNLKAKFVVHTVGPHFDRDPNPAQTLDNCYKNCIKQVRENNCRSIAFPCLATGHFGYPQDAAAHIALSAIGRYGATNCCWNVIICAYHEEDYEIYKRLMRDNKYPTCNGTDLYEGEFKRKKSHLLK